MTIEQLELWITEAKNNLHRLKIGSLPLVVVDQNGERVEYTRTNATGLAAYINTMEAELERMKAGSQKLQGPMRVYY